MSFLVQDVILKMQDHLGNYSTGQANTAQQIRAVDFAVNVLKRKLGLPQDEKKTTFLYSQDQMYYPCTSDFQECIGLFYDDPNKNTVGRLWNYRPYQELLVRTGRIPPGNIWSHTTVNGSHQLILMGSNQTAGQIVESFDSNLWTASGDASGAVTDYNVYIQGSGSERFTLTHGTGQAVLTSNTSLFNFASLINDQGWLNLQVYFPTTAVTSVQMNLISSTGNYYQMTATTNSLGQAWQLNSWNKLIFETATASIVGSPVAQSITQIQLIFNTTSSAANSAQYRVDDLYSTFPDLMDFIYYSNIKGTDSTGSINRTALVAVSDELPYDYDYIEPIALKAALYIWPQLRGDPTFMQLYQAEYSDQVKTWARTWPRKRTEVNNTKTILFRSR